MKSYLEELQELHHRRVYHILMASSVIMILFSLLDLLLVPELYREFLFCRMAGAASCLLLAVVNAFDRSKRYALGTGFASYICISLVILAMIYRMGGVTSPYYAGLILAMTVYAVLAPLTTRQTLGSGFLVVGLYTGTVLLAQADRPTEGFLLDLFANLFFMISVVFIIATQSWTDTRARWREFRLRVEENEAADQLAKEAEILEQEVIKRSREQSETEARYRLLFNQIADDVVLVTPEGEILQANRNFDRNYMDGRPAAGRPFSEIVPKYQHDEIRAMFAEMLGSGDPVRNRQLLLIRRDQTPVEAEVSASLLRRDHAVVGILLLIRDISVRRQMEQQLLTSLETRKKTETAAILALAKLSEFRDVSTSNHLERIREYCRILALELSRYEELQNVMTPTYIEDIYHASILHDIGKVSIPDMIGAQGRPVTEREHELVRRHAIVGGDVIRAMQEESKASSFLDMAKYIAYFHHERWDGKGYPYGLGGRQIPLAARIMTLADTYEEMTAATPDHPGRAGHEEAVEYIVANSGLQFDPMVVGAFTARQEEFKAIRESLAEPRLVQ